MPRLKPTYESSGPEEFEKLQDALNDLTLSLGRDEFPVKVRFEQSSGKVIIDPQEEPQRVYVDGSTTMYCFDVRKSQFSLQSGDRHYCLNLKPTNSQ